MRKNHFGRIASLRKRTADELAAHFQKAEPRWNKRRKQRPKHFSLERQRLRDLLIVLQHRYPDGVPAHIDIDALVKEKAQILGDSLGVTAEERTMLKITTIRPCDQTIDELRKVNKRERDRKRQRGKQSRAAYLATHYREPGPGKRKASAAEHGNGGVSQVRHPPLGLLWLATHLRHPPARHGLP